MQQGKFYFISDEFFEKYDYEGHLMRNKKGEHNRPCFYTFADPGNANIFWCVPVSSQVSKFERIAEQKILYQIKQGVKTPKCNTIRFGEVLGHKKAFLIQNIFPVTDKYILNMYIDKNTNNPVTVSRKLEKEIYKSARDVLKLTAYGHKNLVFSDIMRIRSELIAETEAEK